MIDSPTGQASTEFALPFSDMELENFLLKIGRPRAGVRRIESPENEAARQFGSRLYDAVFAGDVGTQWMRSIDSIEREQCGLRLRLRLSEAPTLADLPWEYLYSPASDDFVVLSSWTPVVRYISLDKGAPPLRVAPPLRMLAMISSPSDYPPLDVEAEWSRLDEGLADLVGRGLVEIHRMERATLRDLQRTLRRQDFHLFHFIGHGGFDEAADDGVLLLETDEGRAREVSGRQLGTILDDARTIRVAVLNACEGARASGTDPFAGVAQSLVARGIPAVVAMQFEITDRAAIVFAHEFYASIADGLAVEASVGEARRAIFGTKSDVEWGTAVLYMRAEDGRLFDLTEPTLVMDQLPEPPAVEEPAVESEEPEAPVADDPVVAGPEVPVVEEPILADTAPRDPELGAVHVAESSSDLDTTVVTEMPSRDLETEWSSGSGGDGSVVDKAAEWMSRFGKTASWLFIGVIAAGFLLSTLSGTFGNDDDPGTTTTAGVTEFGIVNSGVVTMVPTPDIAIDGDLDDWSPLATAYSLRNPVQDDLVDNRLGTDSEGTLWVAYDSEAMYIAVDVVDDVYAQENEGNQIWRGDAVDINLFAGPSGEVPARPDSRTFQLTMTPEAVSGRPGTVLFTGNGSAFSDNTTNLPIDIDGAIEANGSWRLEARVPWSVFGLDGPSDLDAAVFAVFDNDGETLNGRQLQAEILTNLEGVTFQRPPTWGTLIRG